MKKLAVCMLALGLMLTGCGSNDAGESKAKDLSEVKIDAIQLAQHPALDKAYEGFQETLKEAGISKDQIDYQNASGEPSNCQTITEKFANDNVVLFTQLRLMLCRQQPIRQQQFQLLVQQ